MKTKLISLLLSCVLFLSLAACAKEGSGSDETTKETTAQTTEENTTQTDTTGEETTEPADELALNTDLLSDIGLTYPQLVEKRGEKVDAVGREGVGFYFENGYGAYMWGYEDLDYGRELESGESYPFPRDENNNLDGKNVQLPKAEIPCNSIIQVKVKDLLKNAFFPIDISELHNIEGLENYRSGEEGIVTTYNYYFNFQYEKVEISIYHNDLDTIEADSEVSIRVRTN